MIELYCGDGKGKTTAAVGLAVRAAGHDIPVVFAQFLKNDTSGEIASLRKLDKVKIIHPVCSYGFVSSMTCEQKLETKKENNKILVKIKEFAVRHEKSVVILDEVVHAINFDLIDKSAVKELLDIGKTDIEIVMTGRNPADDLIEVSDYYTEFINKKHVYDRGITAREGIEY